MDIPTKFLLTLDVGYNKMAQLILLGFNNIN